MEKILVYTDGSSKKDKKGSYAFVAVNPDNLEIIYQEAGAISSPLTNIFFELLSLVKAMDYVATHHPNSKSVFVTDCTANIDCFVRVKQKDTQMFKNQICNQLASKMFKIISQDEMKYTTVEKVKAHDGDYFNHIVDQLCVMARKKIDISMYENQSVLKDSQDDYLKSLYYEKSGYKINDWFKNASQGIEFTDKPMRFDKKYNYIGEGEVRVFSFSDEYVKKLEEYAKKNKVYIVEKSLERLRIYKNTWADFFPNHPLKPVYGKNFALFNGNLKMTEKFADCTINDDYLVKIAKKPEFAKKPLPQKPKLKAHEIQQQMENNKKIKKKI